MSFAGFYCMGVYLYLRPLNRWRQAYSLSNSKIKLLSEQKSLFTTQDFFERLRDRLDNKLDFSEEAWGKFLVEAPALSEVRLVHFESSGFADAVDEPARFELVLSGSAPNLLHFFGTLEMHYPIAVIQEVSLKASPKKENKPVEMHLIVQF